MKQPIEPSKEDCCDSGCNPCVFDVYEKQIKLYRAYIKNGSEANVVEEENAISQLEYTAFRIVVSIDICLGHKLIAFKMCNNSSGKVIWKPGDHFLVKYNSGELVCTRAYTPLKYSVGEFDSDFEIIVKKYENGIVSDYLCNLKGQETLWRGPYGSYEYVPNKYIRIIMIAQGTGIAPLYSIVQNILNNEDDFTKIVLFFCCPSQETILFRDDLYSFQSYWNFKYSVFLSRSSICDCKYQEPIKCKRLQLEDVKSLNPFSINDQFLLCGSPSFMDEFRNALCTQHITTDNIIML